MFDRAAVRLRGQRAKLNFNIQEYTDAEVSERVGGVERGR